MSEILELIPTSNDIIYRVSGNVMDIINEKY